MNVRISILCLTAFLFLLNCADRTGIYDMPSVRSGLQPGWVGVTHPTRDTVYVVIDLPASYRGDIQLAGQTAQSMLNERLASSIEPIITGFFDEKLPELNPEQRFNYLSDLPIIIEQIMQHAGVMDGWENEQGISILCAIDAESAALAVIESMELPERSFLVYFKRQLDHWVRDLEQN